MIKFRGRTFNEVRKDIKALPMRELRDLYRSYRRLQAKGVQDTMFEQMLEDELDRRI
jgi:hypothetical protein